MLYVQDRALSTMSIFILNTKIREKVHFFRQYNELPPRQASGYLRKRKRELFTMNFMVFISPPLSSDVILNSCLTTKTTYSIYKIPFRPKLSSPKANLLHLVLV